MWSSWTEKAKEAIAQAEHLAEQAGDAITRAATKSSTPATADETAFQEEIDNVEKEVAAGSKTTTSGAITASGINIPSIPHVDKEQFMNLWSSVVESTKRAAEATKDAVEATKDAVETSRSNLERQFLRKGTYKRDPKLPLDVEALRDAEVVYITDRIITMSHPATASRDIPAITAERKLAAIGHLLNRRHDGRFLVWNLSEVGYDISILDNQVLTFSFPGSPSPPLGLLLKLLVSMENWMKADERNIAVVHCLTGKGRTSTVLAAFLSWMGEAGFGDINEALAYIAKCKQLKPEDLTIPSQRRYAFYFKNMLDGVRPSQPPLLLKRIIMSEAPKFAKGPPRDNVQIEKQDGQTGENDEAQLMGCAPYLQIFKGGKLIHTAAATLHVQQAEEELPFVQIMDGTVPFNIEQIIQGDILIRCRHLTFSKKRVSMFRAAFHTGYVPPNILRLTKSQLDGACTDKRFPDDFFLDLIFEKPDADAIARHLEKEANEEDEDNKEGKGRGPVVKAASYDSMLVGDSRFWDVIKTKKQEHMNQSNNGPFWGPTVGRRRADSEKGSPKNDESQANLPERTQLETFSIGNEFDFLPVMAKADVVQSSSMRDSLMDALNALEEDEGHHPDDTEEIIFADTNTSPSMIIAQDSEQSPPISGSVDENVVGVDQEVTATNETEDSLGVSENKAERSSQIGKKEMSEADDDMDALLASADEDFGELDLADFDDDDDLEDLENMLKT